MLVEVSQSQSKETPAQLPLFKKECRPQKLGHPASLTKQPPPLSHRGDAQRGTIRCCQCSIHFRRRQRRSKTGESGFESHQSITTEDLKMFWITANCEAIHDANHWQCSCQNDPLPNRHTPRTNVVERQQLNTIVTVSRLIGSMQRPVDELRKNHSWLAQRSAWPLMNRQRKAKVTGCHEKRFDSRTQRHPGTTTCKPR